MNLLQTNPFNYIVRKCLYLAFVLWKVIFLSLKFKVHKFSLGSLSVFPYYICPSLQKVCSPFMCLYFWYPAWRPRHHWVVSSHSMCLSFAQFLSTQMYSLYWIWKHLIHSFTQTFFCPSSLQSFPVLKSQELLDTQVLPSLTNILLIFFFNLGSPFASFGIIFTAECFLLQCLTCHTPQPEHFSC